MVRALNDRCTSSLMGFGCSRLPMVNGKGKKRFFGDPTPIQRNYTIDEHIELAGAHGFKASVHIQVGAANALEEAKWVDKIAKQNPSWPMVQVAFCDLSLDDCEHQLDELQKLSSVVGVRQIIGRSPLEDTISGTNTLLESDAFKAGLSLSQTEAFLLTYKLYRNCQNNAQLYFHNSKILK